MYKNYNINQLVLPLNLEIKIQDNDIARHVNNLVESIPKKAFDKYYKETGCPAYHPRMMLKILLCAYSQSVFSGRKIEALLSDSIRMMWLAQGYSPSYRTINRFRSNKEMQELLCQCFIQFRAQLIKEKIINNEAIFIDGTKIEANANKFSFVWKKSVEKYGISLIENSRRIYDELVEQEIIPAIELEQEATINEKEMVEVVEKLDSAIEVMDKEIAESDSVEKRKRIRHKRKLPKQLRKILKENIFDNIWIQPASGDAGGALGAALWAYYEVLNNDRKIVYPDAQKGSLLGSEFSNEQIKSSLDKIGAKYVRYEEGEISSKIAEYISQGKIVGHLNGRAEFGPRALGNRSILADARNTEMQKKLNLAVKKRESFRPFAPTCLEGDAADYFTIPKGKTSPYMLLTVDVQPDKRLEVQDKDKNLFGIEQLNIVRSQVPAITHVDYSARLQTVSEKTNSRYYSIINEFKKLTGCPVIVNTSFNVRGEPLVNSPDDAYRCFMFTDIDVLVVGNYLLLKNEQPPLQGYKEYLKTLRPD